MLVSQSWEGLQTVLSDEDHRNKTFLVNNLKDQISLEKWLEDHPHVDFQETIQDLQPEKVYK